MVCVFDAYSQASGTKPNVYIDYFNRPDDMSFNEAEQLRNSIMQALKETNRIDLIDVDSNKAIAIERERREAGAVADDDPERLKVMVQEGANYLIQGRITSWAVNQSGKKGKEFYDVVVNYNLKMINPNDGKVVNSQSFKVGGGLISEMISRDKKVRSKEEALMDACKEASYEIEHFIAVALPLEGKVLDMGKVKKDKVDNLYVNLGSNIGVKENDIFLICIQRNIGGEVANSEIGRVVIAAVEGGNVSLAKVKKGKKDIYNAINAGQNIVVRYVPKESNVNEKLERIVGRKFIGGRPVK